MNQVILYTWDDAPASLRREAETMVPPGYVPRWLGYAEKQGKPPTYLLALASSAWIGVMTGDWNKVFVREVGGGEVRVGCEKRR